MPIKKGGVRLIDPTFSSWQAVWYMINIEGAKISLISNNSLTGIIFRLDVFSGNTLFNGIKKDRTPDDYGNFFNKDVYTLVFKFSILAPTIEYYTIVEEKEKKIIKKEKLTSTILDTLNETAIQQEIFCVTMIPTGYPITIAIVDFSYFDTKHARILLNTLMSKSKDSITLELLEQLDGIIERKPSYQLGLISMELVDTNFKTMYQIVSNVTIDQSIKNIDYEHVIAQMVILVVTAKILHYDLHMDNAFGSELQVEKDNNDRSYIIDFGRTRRITESFVNRFMNKVLSQYFTEIKKLSITDLYPPISSDKTLEKKLVDNLERIILFMGYLDRNINRPRVQSEGFIKYLFPYFPHGSQRGVGTEEKLLKISKIIENLTSMGVNTGTGFSNASVKKYIKQEQIFSTPLLDSLSPSEKIRICNELYLRNNLELWDKEKGKGQGEKQRIKNIKDKYDNSLLKALKTFFKVAPYKHQSRSNRPLTYKGIELERQKQQQEEQKQKRGIKIEENRRKKEEQERQQEIYAERREEIVESPMIMSIRSLGKRNPGSNQSRKRKLGSNQSRKRKLMSQSNSKSSLKTPNSQSGHRGSSF
jgi:hypothetical protein